MGAGVFPKEQSEREEASFIPKGADWIQDSVAELQPEHKCVVTQTGRLISYDYLVIALGIQVDWNKIPGLAEGLGRQQICSNYSYQQVDYTWECVSKFQGGTALFTMPNTISHRLQWNMHESDLAKTQGRSTGFAMTLLKQLDWQPTTSGMTEPCFIFLPIRRIAKRTSAD